MNCVLCNFDVRTVHLQRASKIASSVSAQVREIEDDKNKKYVVSLTGAVSETAFRAVKEITRHAARGARPRLEWERHRWAVDIVQRVAVATIKATAFEATRTPYQSTVRLRVPTLGEYATGNRRRGRAEARTACAAAGAAA